MIGRKAKSALLRLSEQFPVVGITGPRQSGKSTLTKATFPEKKYITFDDRNLRELAKANPRDFLAAFPDGVIIDEAQKVPDIFDALKIVVDSTNTKAGKYILTGSSQFHLRKNMSDSLSGRGAFLELLPFSCSELNEESLLPENPYDFILRGQYPPLYDPEKKFNADDWFESYIDTYLTRDVGEEINLSNLSTFRKFIQICATYSGQILSMESISKYVGVSSPTIKKWLSILENSYLIHFLLPDANNLGRALIKSPKLYFVDTGLLCHLLMIESKEDLLLSTNKGAIVETFAISEMLKKRTNMAKKANLTYFRDRNGFEIDTIADWKKTFAFEIKSTSEPEGKLSANIRKYLTLKNDPKTKGAVLYMGDLTMKINDIDYVGWKDWGKYPEVKG